MISRNEFYETTDSGNSWFKVSKSYSDEITKIDFVNNTTGWALGKFNLYKSIDGGRNWQIQYSSTNYFSYGGLDMIDSLEG